MFKQTISEVHPNLGDSEVLESITNGTLEFLSAAIQKLRGLKIQRMQRVNYVLCFEFSPHDFFCLSFLGLCC